MSQPIDIRPDHLQIVQDILNAHIPNHTVWVFGSRAKWTTKDYSDLDLCVKGSEPLSSTTLERLRDDFSESSLPYKVDIVDWYDINESFRKIIEKDKILFPQVKWSSLTLSDVADIVMGQSPSGETCNQGGVGIPLLNGPTEFGSSYPEATQYTVDPKKIAQKGDLLFCVRGSTTGRMNWADNQYAIGRGLAAIRHKKGLYYKHYLKGIMDFNLPNLLAAATGSTFPNLSKDQILGMKILVPPLYYQKAISEILSALDDKIELNRQMNETLEAIARALFKSWFVDFDPVRAKMEGRQPEDITLEFAEIFPDKFVDSSLGKIPKGWEVKQLDRIIELIGGGTPNTGISEYWDGDVPWFSVVDAPNESDVFVIDTEKKISKLGLDKSSTKILFTGTTIVTARGTVGKVALVGVPMAMNQSCYGIRSIYDDSYWTYFQIRRVVSELQKLAHGSIFDTITRATFSSILVICPPPSLIRAFDMLVTPLLERIRLNIFNKLKVTQVRANLLPKLISGTLRVNNSHEVVNG